MDEQCVISELRMHWILPISHRVSIWKDLVLSAAAHDVHMTNQVVK